MEEALAGVEDAGLQGLNRVLTATNTGDAGFVSRDGKATFVVLEFDGTTEEVQGQIPALRRALGSTDLTTYLTGDPAVYAELEQRSAEDLRKAEAYALPVAILVLVVIFGTLVAASLPVIGGGMAVTVTMGCFWLLAHVVDISVFALNVATLLGLAVGIDYALFMVGRFREELAAGRSVAEAVETTVEFAGRSIFFSGVTVVVGLLGLMIIPYMSMRSMGLGGALVVLFSVLAALTLLPALLGDARAEGELTARHRAHGRRRALLAPLERLGHAAPDPGADRDDRPGDRLRVAGAEHPDRDPGGDRPAARLRGAAGLRPAAAALRRGRALSDRGAGHVGGRARPVRAGEPATPVRLRAGARRASPAWTA